jgi:hypothetical protein
VILYPSQLTGRRVYWLLTVDVGGVLMRMADDEVDVVTASVKITRGMGAPWAEGIAFLQGQPTALLDLSRMDLGGGA